MRKTVRELQAAEKHVDFPVNRRTFFESAGRSGAALIATVGLGAGGVLSMLTPGVGTAYALPTGRRNRPHLTGDGLGCTGCGTNCTCVACVGQSTTEAEAAAVVTTRDQLSTGDP